MIYALALAGLLAADGGSNRFAPGGSWQVLAVSGSPPSARRDAAMAYDRVRNRVILFGGQASGTQFDDTWALDLTTLTWTPLATGPSLRPTARFSMVSGIDSTRDRFLVATGQGTGFFDDVWAFDLASDSWSQVVPSGAPPQPRYGSAGGVYDPATPGPTGATLYVSHGFTNLGRFDDTIALDLANDTWRDATPSPPLPLKRCLHAGALSAADRLVLFGGCGSPVACPLDDTWRLDDAAPAWTDLTNSIHPSARIHPAVATMGDGPFLLLFGGSASGGQNDVWQLDARDGAWTQLSPTGTAPAGRDGASLVWIDNPDPMLGGSGCGWALMFGGETSSVRNDLWALRPTVPIQPPVLYVVKAGAVVDLQWGLAPEATRYEVWRADARRLERGSPGLILLPGPITIGSVSASSTDATLDPPLPRHFYRVRLAACGL